MAPRNLLASTALAALLANSALAQDATIRYSVPTIQSGQPVAAPAPIIQPVPVYTPVPMGAQAGAPEPVTMPTADDADYLGTPQVQVSQHDQSIRFVTGGTGAFEKAWFTTNQHDYNLKVFYNDSTGHNLAGVTSDLTDKSGETLVTVTTEGPFLLIGGLKPGTYNLSSSYEGASQTRKVTIGKGLSTTNVTFNDTNPDM